MIEGNDRSDVHPADQLGAIRGAVDLLRKGELSDRNFGAILSAAEILFDMASTGRAGCSAAEANVARWTGGRVMKSYDAGYDVVARSGARIEVKFSKLNQPNKVRDSFRWNWTNILGNASALRKDYDYLVLVGQKDDRFAGDYPIIDGAFVVFAIHRDEIEGNPDGLRLSPASRGTIALSTAPNIAHTRNFIEHFAVSASRLEVL